jgi:hypothetical protein
MEHGNKLTMIRHPSRTAASGKQFKKFMQKTAIPGKKYQDVIVKQEPYANVKTGLLANAMWTRFVIVKQDQPPVNATPEPEIVIV